MGIGIWIETSSLKLLYLKLITMQMVSGQGLKKIQLNQKQITTQIKCINALAIAHKSFKFLRFPTEFNCLICNMQTMCPHLCGS